MNSKNHTYPPYPQRLHEQETVGMEYLLEKLDKLGWLFSIPKSTFVDPQERFEFWISYRQGPYSLQWSAGSYPEKKCNCLVTLEWEYTEGTSTNDTIEAFVDAAFLALTQIHEEIYKKCQC